MKLRLGAFSVSLNVKDIRASKAFYESLGFREFGGEIDQNWLIMKNENAVIGLFQGMFEQNILTFNPGWDQNAQELADFEDIRTIQREAISRGITPTSEIDPDSSGPGSIILKDPDGNTILIDQHV